MFLGILKIYHHKSFKYTKWAHATFPMLLCQTNYKIINLPGHEVIRIRWCWFCSHGTTNLLSIQFVVEIKKIIFEDYIH